MTAPTQQYGANGAAPLPPSAEDFMFGGGVSRKGRSMKFPMIGTTNSGTICDTPRTEQQRDPETGDLKFWPPRQGQTIGDPVYQVVVPVQVDLAASPALRSQEVIEAAGEDDGVRYFYFSGSKDPASMSSLSAVAAAVQSAGAKKLEVGGRLTITYVRDMPKRPGASAVSKPPKGYVAEYAPPAQVMLEPAAVRTGTVVPDPALAAQTQNAGLNQFATTAQQQVAQPVAQAPAQQAVPEVTAPAQPVGETREQIIAREFGHLPVPQLNGLIASGMPIETLREMGRQAGWIS